MKVLRKTAASGLIATLLISQQGPLFYQALAQTVAASASGASSGSLGASAGRLQGLGGGTSSAYPSVGSLGSGAQAPPSAALGLSPLPSVPTLTSVLTRGLKEPARASAVGLAAQAADSVREQAPAPVLRAAAPSLALPPAASRPLGPVPVNEAHPLGKISVHAPASAESAEKTADGEKQVKRPGMLSQLSAFGKSLAQAGRTSSASLLAKAFDRSKQTSDTAEDADRVEAGEELGTRKRAGLVPSGSGQADWLKLKALKRVLGDGTDSGKGAIGPFGFKSPQGTWSRARSAGLEGFLYSKLEHERAWGEKASLAQLDDYFAYLEALLAPAAQVSEVHDLRSGLKALAASPAAPLEKNRELNSLLVAGLNLLRAQAASLDKASWGRSAGIYMVLARAYNRLRPGKGFFDSFDEAEFERIRKETHADTVWLLDIFEIGVPRRWGTGGGSPYSISGYRVKKELGGDEALKRFSERAHKAGMRVMTDFIPNHTSLDSELIKERPEAVLHIVPPQDLSDAEIMAGVPREASGPRSPVFFLVETDNYPEYGRSQDLGGGIPSGHPSVSRRVHKKILVHHPRTDYGDVMWIDMAQIDYSRADARTWEIEQARRVFEDLGVDAVRRDMAYEQTNARFFDRWVKILEMEKNTGAPWAAKEMERLIAEFKVRWSERGGAEFWEQFSDATKSRFPASFAIDEVYSNSTEMSRSGSDGVYNKNTHDESMGQVGLYDAMVGRDAGRIRAALRNMAFRAWQKGGAGLVNFIGTHDGGEGNPWDKFGVLGRAAAATALLFRPVLIYNGVEQGVGQARNVRGDLSKSVDREKSIPFDIPAAIDWSERDQANASYLEMVLGKSAEHADLLSDGAAEVLEPDGDTPIVAYTIGRSPPSPGMRHSLDRKNGKALLVAANFSERPAGARFKMGRPVLKDFGAFEPKAGKIYLLRDFADIQRDGSPKEYRRTGDELLKDGITILLGPGGTHVMEVSELDASAPATGPPQKTQAPQGGTLLEEASTAREPFSTRAVPTALWSAAGIGAPVQTSSEKGASPKKAPFWKASWADWTQRLTAFSMVPFALLQLPQILKNAGNLAAGNAAALSGLPWMGYSTGILGNMLLLSYFSSQKEKSAAAAQAVGVLESAVVVTQIFLAGFMPAAAFAVVMPVVTAGLLLNGLKAFGRLPDKILGVNLWSLWNKLTNLLGFFALPMGFAMSFGLAQAHRTASLAASLALAGAGLYLIVREAQGRMDKLPPALQWVWKKIGAALASLLFMFGPVSQIMNNIGNPAGMAGISVETLLLAMVGNLLMLPRALFVKDKLWFAGSSWGAWVGGWAVLLSMMLAGYLSPLFFGSATAALASYMGFILYKSRKAPAA